MTAGNRIRRPGRTADTWTTTPGVRRDTWTRRTPLAEGEDGLDGLAG